MMNLPETLSAAILDIRFVRTPPPCAPTGISGHVSLYTTTKLGAAQLKSFDLVPAVACERSAFDDRVELTAIHSP
jgi:hypothetical protein